MARQIDYTALRTYVLQGRLDSLLPFAHTANELGIQPGATPLPPLSADEIRLSPGSLNVRAFIEWMHDYDDDDEAILKAALASLSERMPGMLLEPETEDGPAPVVQRAPAPTTPKAAPSAQRPKSRIQPKEKVKKSSPKPLT